MSSKRNLLPALLLGLGFAGAAGAKAPFRLTVAPDAATQGGACGGHFTGLSFEVNDLEPHYLAEGYIFDADSRRSPKCRELIRLAKNMGLKSLRIGGSWGEAIAYGSDYSQPAIDALFAFAREAGVKVILQLRLKGRGGYDPLADSVREARYVWQNYRSQLDFFSIGNESNWKSYHTNTLLGAASIVVDPRIYETDATPQRPGSAYPSYVRRWKEFAAAIVDAAGAEVRFGGPDSADENGGTNTWWNNGTARVSWTQAFIDDCKAGRIRAHVVAGLQHHYAGGNGLLVSSALVADTAMLSPRWLDDDYSTLYRTILEPVSRKDGYSYRFTEANDYTSGVPGASDTFAGALWALDYLHWQAQRDPHCIGVNFHNNLSAQKDGSHGIPTATIWIDARGNYHARPKAAAIRMFDLGGVGRRYNTVAVTKSDPNASVTVYAMGTSADMYVTIINKTNAYVGGDCREALATVAPAHFTIKRAAYIEMDSYPRPQDVRATEATVGGSSVNDNAGAWQGTWRELPVSSQAVQVSVPPAAAGIVHLISEQRKARAP